jgi:hypothetical protein
MASPFGAAQEISGFVSDADRARVAAFLRSVFWTLACGDLAKRITVAKLCHFDGDRDRLLRR